MFKNKVNSGAAATRNNGLIHVRGKYTLVIDSDDALEPQALSKSYKRAEEDNLDVFMFQPKGFNEKTQQFEYAPAFDIIFFNDLNVRFFSYPQFIDNLFQVTLLTAWNKLIRTDLIEKNNLRFAEHKYYDDSYFTTMVFLKAERISYTEEELYMYRINREGSQSNRYSDSEKLYGKLELAKALRYEFKKMKLQNGAYYSLIRWMSREKHPLADSKLQEEVQDFIADTYKNYISLRADNAN